MDKIGENRGKRYADGVCPVPPWGGLPGVCVRSDSLPKIMTYEQKRRRWLTLTSRGGGGEVQRKLTVAEGRRLESGFGLGCRKYRKMKGSALEWTSSSKGESCFGGPGPGNWDSSLIATGTFT